MKVQSIGAALFVICAPMFAHHGTGVSYDNSKAYTVKATVGANAFTTGGEGGKGKKQ